MASIILAFVGTQYSDFDRTKEEESIVTLVKHLLADRSEITLYLLFTHDLHERAELTE
jgi:hypothetical protein